MDKVISGLRKSSNDSEKFAYLLVLTKIPSSQLTPEKQNEISNSIGISFIYRLLQTSAESENSVAFKKLGLTILRTCFLIPSYVGDAPKLTSLAFRVIQEVPEPEVEEDALEVLGYFGDKAPAGVLPGVISNFDSIQQSPLKHTYYSLIRHMYQALSSENSDIFISIRIELTKKYNSFDFSMLTINEKERVTLDDAMLFFDLLGIETLEKTSGYPILESKYFDFVKSKLKPEDRRTVLQFTPQFTSRLTYFQRPEVLLCYRLSAIELKLTLEEVAHQLERNQDVPSVSHIVMACCQTLEDAIDELVGESQSMSVETSSELISALRMTMQSVMFFIGREAGAFQLSFFPAVFRVYMRWLSEDNFNVVDVVESFQHLMKHLRGEQWHDLCPFLVSATINQMESGSFVDFMKEEFGEFLLRVTLAKLPEREKEVIRTAPIFNEMLARKLYIEIGNTVADDDVILKVVIDALALEETTLTTRTLSIYQVIMYVMLCLYQHNHPLLHQNDDMNYKNFLIRVISYVIRPFKTDTYPKNWSDVRDIWVSVINTICTSLHIVKDLELHNVVDVDVLVKKSLNASEDVAEVTDAMEELLSAIIG